MAVYTILDHHELQKLLSNFDLPELKCFEGASSGIENTTYFLTLTSGTQYVLTIFEYFTSEQLFPYISLTTILNQHNLPVPCPCLDKCGVALQQVAGKVALLFPRASGKHIGITDITSCEQIGSVLSRIHLVTTSQSINLSIINPCGLA